MKVLKRANEVKAAKIDGKMFILINSVEVFQYLRFQLYVIMENLAIRLLREFLLISQINWNFIKN